MEVTERIEMVPGSPHLDLPKCREVGTKIWLSKSVVGCMVAPPKDTSMPSFLETVNVPLFGKRGLCRCNQVNDLERRRYSWIIQVSPNCKDKCPCQKEAGGDLREEEKWRPGDHQAGRE